MYIQIKCIIYVAYTAYIHCIMYMCMSTCVHVWNSWSVKVLLNERLVIKHWEDLVAWWRHRCSLRIICTDNSPAALKSRLTYMLIYHDVNTNHWKHWHPHQCCKIQDIHFFLTWSQECLHMRYLNLPCRLFPFRTKATITLSTPYKHTVGWPWVLHTHASYMLFAQSQDLHAEYHCESMCKLE